MKKDCEGNEGEKNWAGMYKSEGKEKLMCKTQPNHLKQGLITKCWR